MKSSFFSFNHRKCLLRYFYILIFIFPIFNSTYSQSWNALGAGASGTVYAVTIFNNELIFAGSFTSAGGITANNIVRWNGSSWLTLGSGTNGAVYALTVFNNTLIAGGAFTTAGGNTSNRIASWNGSSWSPLTIGMNDNVYALSVHNSQLIAGGAFTTAGGVNVYRIARWSGSAWNYLTSNGLNDNVYALMVFNNDLIASGRFNASGTSIMKRVARFYSSGTYYYIYALGSGIDTGTANALTVFNNELYVGGRFPAVGGITVNNIARWNGSNWNLVATGVNDSVCSLYSYNSVLYAGGTFTAAGATIANRIARWTGNSWTSMSTGMSGMNPCVKSIFPWQNIVFAAGMFSSAGGVPVNNIAGWGTFPAAPSLIYPPDAASGIPVNLTFTWNSVPYAASYALQVARDPNFNNIVVNAVSLTNPQYQVLPGVLDYDNTYFWKVNARNGLGIGPWSLIRFFRTSLVGIIDPGVIPLEFKLYQNYPNPFNPSTIIRFNLPVTNDKNAHIDLVLYDLLGKEVAVLYSNDYAGGKYEITIDADKINMSSGVYFVKLTAGGRSAINRIMLVK